MINNQIETKHNTTTTAGGGTTESLSVTDHSRQCSSEGKALADTQTFQLNPDRSAHDHESFSFWEADGSTMSLHRDRHGDPAGNSKRHTQETTPDKDGHRQTYTKDEEFDSQGHRTKLVEKVTPDLVDPKAPLGVDIATPCSCEGNWCQQWPLPEVFPRGYRWERSTVTSSISGAGGTYVTEPDVGGRCVLLDPRGAATVEPAPASFKVTTPGTHVLTIRTSQQAGIADCNHPTCASVSATTVSLTFEERYFTVESRPQCGQGRHP
jgi:hypothetical protein